METAFSSNQGFISFSPSPEPEGPPPPPPPPTTTTAAPAAAAAAAAAAGPSSTRSQHQQPPLASRTKRTRDERERRDRLAEDDPDNYRNRKEERRAGSRSTPWVGGIDWLSCRNPAEMLNREIRAFVSYISPTPTEHATRSHIVALIRSAVVAQWRDAAVSPFGSFETGLYLPTGDIDLVIESPTMDKQNKVSVLHTLAAVLRRANLAENIQVISKAKVPIVKFISSYGRLPVDISINQSNGISAGKIVNAYISALPALKPLVLVVKAFLSQRGMNEVYSGGLGSYSVICLVISFLQVHPKVRRAEIDPLANLGTLLIEFFELYGKNFGYDDTGISLRDGGSYYSKDGRGWSNERQRYLLSIEDPQDTSNDISRGSHGILRVRSTFSGAYEVLTSRLYIRAEGIARRRRGSSSGKHARSDADDESDMSILVGIMGVSAEVLSQRRTLKDLHDSGRLQDRLGIPRDAPPPPDLPSFAQAAAAASSSSRSPPRLGRPQTKLAAIHVEPSPERPSGRSDSTSASEADDDRRRRPDDRRRHRGRRRRGSTSESEDGYRPTEFDFVDEPFRPSARAGAADRRSGSGVVSSTKSAPPLPAPTKATTSSSSRKSRVDDEDDDDEKEEEESRYSVGKPPAGKKRKGNLDAFAAPPVVKGKGQQAGSRTSSPEEGEISSVSSPSASSDDMYVEGQEELLATSDESDFEEQERRFRQAKKQERRKARESRRAYWQSKGGDVDMEAGMRYGGLLSD